MTDAELSATYQRLVASRADAGRSSCPAPERLLALVEARGPEAERIADLNHVMACPFCHPELGLLDAVNQSGAHGAGARQRGIVARWAAAAAVIFVIGGGALLLTRARIDSHRAAPDIERSGGDAGAVVLAEARVVPSPTGAPAPEWRLSWRPVPGATRYDVEVLRPDNSVVFSRRTTDTTIVAAVPGARAGTTWWVRAELPGGSELRSRVAPLVTGAGAGCAATGCR